MTNAAVLNKTSNLVMPMHYVELDMDEMSYVEGGAFIGLALSAEQCRAFAELGGTASRGLYNSLTAQAVVGSAITAFFSWVLSLPIVGIIAFAAIGAVALTIAGLALTAAIKGTGVYAGVNINYKPAGFLGLFGKWESNWEFKFR